MTLKGLVRSLLIFIFGGTLNIIDFCDDCDESWQAFSISFAYGGLFWVSLWKGSESLVNLLNRLVPWIESPIKRLIASLISIVVFVYIVIWTLDIFFDLVILQKSLSDALESTGANYLNVFIITLFMNVIMHGRGFLLSWRQASIDIERLKVQQISTQYESLKNQVNPHFLFNSLNVLTSLVYDDQDKAAAFIRKLSQVYRYVLDNKEEEVVNTQEELAFTQDYVYLQKIRFGDNLQVQIEGSPFGYLPPLALQILVENAIKHNVVSEKYPLIIDITLSEEVCVVTNTIREKLEKDSTGIGLSNLKKRYHYLTAEEVTVKNSGDAFSVSLPVLSLKP